MATENKRVNELPTITDAKDWLKSMGERGVYLKSVVQLRAGAIDALASVLQGDESQAAQSFLDQLDEVTNRWATLKRANPETAQAYRSRVRGALTEFLQ